MSDPFHEPPAVNWEGDERFGTVPEMIAEIRALRAAVAPFAAIVPSSIYPADGSEAEAYRLSLARPGMGEFTGADLARARAAIAKSRP